MTNFSFLFLSLLLSLTTTVIVNADGCSVCGEGNEVTAADEIFEFPGQPSVKCGDLEEAGKNGLIPLEQCSFLPALILVCQCEEVDPDRDSFTEDAPTIETSSVAPITSPPVTLPPVTEVPTVLKGDFRCGVDVLDAQTNCGNLCLTNADCAPGLSCWGSWNSCYVQDSSPPPGNPKSPLPADLQAISDFRCGVSEVDARSNCGKTCLNSADCDSGEECWNTHTNYCHVKPKPHPQCDFTKAEQIHRRCGHDEEMSRGFCGTPCEDSTECGLGEKCFPVQLNLCDCFKEQDLFYAELNAVEAATEKSGDDDDDGSEIEIRRQLQLPNGETNAEYFKRAKEPLEIYYLNDLNNNKDQNGNSTSSAVTQQFWVAASIIVVVFVMIQG